MVEDDVLVSSFYNNFDSSLFDSGKLCNSRISDINQIDGADTVSGCDNSNDEDQVQDLLSFSDILPFDGAKSTSSTVRSCSNVPVVNFIPRARNPKHRDAPKVLKVIHRNEKINSSSTLPVVAVANVRSLLPKLNSTIEKIENEEIDIALICEVWEKTGKKNRNFQSRVEEMMEMKGLKYISCGARPSGKRGGGAAIVANTSKFSLEKLDVQVPNNLEVQWGIVRPKVVSPITRFKEILVCSFYSPPASRKHCKLLDHLVSATHALMARYPQAALILGGDKNSLPLAPLLLALPRFAQIVAHSTHGDKILDVLVMSCPDLYAVPLVTPPVLPDDPRHAAPSDHRVPVARPLASAPEAVCNVYKEKVYRPLPDSLVREFMQWIHTEAWDTVPTYGTPTEQVHEFEKLVDEKIEILFPEKIIRVSKKDKEWITTELKNLDKRTKREWRQKGKSDKYVKLKKEFGEKYKKAASDYIQKCVTDLKTEHPGRAAATLKRMGAQPGDCGDDGSFTLLNHIQEGLSVDEQLERFSEYFVSVSQEFPPLELSQLSEETNKKLSEICQEEIPILQDYEIFRILDKSKRKKSTVPGDMPPRLFYDASAGLATPAAKIMNQIAQTGLWPSQYQVEYAMPLEKVKPAKDESQARLISLTNKMNVIFEKQVIVWLMQCVRNKIDRDQFGGMKGHSISHYLIEMTNFILYNQDLKDPHATIGIFIDYKQGFNRCQHSIFIEIMSQDFQVPGWLLRILIGYLSGRKLRVKYKSKLSAEKDIYGGGGQGCPLGFWIFCFMIDKAGPKSDPKPIGQIITQPINRRQTIEKTKKKWVDDFTVLTSVDLKQRLVPDPAPTRPVPQRGRTEHLLPRQDNPLQAEVDSIVKYSKEKKMVLNPIKTKIMIFNPLKKYDVLPLIETEPGIQIEVVEKHKILGQIVRSDMRTISNTENICKKAYKKMWIVRRLKSLGCSNAELIEVVKQQIITVCEVGAAWWGPMISSAESNMLERTLKTSLHIIFQEQYRSFKHALNLANLSSLRNRRIALLTKFSKKAYQSDKFKSWFFEPEKTHNDTHEKITRQPVKCTPLLQPVTCRTQRYARSSIPVMTQLLSWHPPLRYTPLDLA